MVFQSGPSDTIFIFIYFMNLVRKDVLVDEGKDELGPEERREGEKDYSGRPTTGRTTEEEGGTGDDDTGPGRDPGGLGQLTWDGRHGRPGMGHRWWRFY